MIQSRLQFHLFAVLAALLFITCPLVLSLAALTVTEWLQQLLGLRGSLFIFKERECFMQSLLVDSSLWISCVSAYLINRDLGCLCYERSFSGCMYREQLGKAEIMSSLYSKRQVCLLSSVIKIMSPCQAQFRHCYYHI